MFLPSSYYMYNISIGSDRVISAYPGEQRFVASRNTDIYYNSRSEVNLGTRMQANQASDFCSIAARCRILLAGYRLTAA